MEVGATVRRHARRAAMPFAAPPAALRVRRFVRGRPSFAEAFDFIHAFRPPADCAITLGQRRAEIERLCRLLGEQRPRAVLEVGTAGGGTLFLFAGEAADDAILVSIDLPHPGGYRRHRGVVYRAFARPGQRIVALRADSHDPRTATSVQSLFGPRPVDFLFIDGDHSAVGVARDYELYSPLVRPGGMIAFHDIVPGSVEHVGGVPEFWQELKRRLEDGTEELVESWSQRGYGIGVVRLPA